MKYLWLILWLLPLSCGIEFYHPKKVDGGPTKSTDLIPLNCGPNYHRMEITARWKEGRMEYSYVCSNKTPGIFLKMEE